MISTLLTKIDIRDILTGHFRSLRNATVAGPSYYDYSLFYVVPLIPVAFMAFYSVKLTDGTVSALTTALSILAGLLFNLIVLLHSLQLPPRGEPIDSRVQELLQELHANIAYSIVVSLITLGPLVVASYYGPNDLPRTILGDLSAYLTVHFVLTMGMVLKRMDAMLKLRWQ